MAVSLMCDWLLRKRWHMANITAMHLKAFGRHMCLVDRDSVTLKHTTQLMRKGIMEVKWSPRIILLILIKF